MALAGDSVYLPSLDKCLDGNHQLLSWKTTFTWLSQNSSVSSEQQLRRHLTDDQTVQHLVLFLTPFTPFTPQTPQTPSTFESQTSPINIAPSTDGRYDINQLKEDSLWLSRKAGISELAALRIVVLEWQARSTTQLLNAPLGSGEFQQNHTRGGKNSEPSSSRQSPTGRAKRALDSRSEEQGARRLRLLELYLSERQYLSKTTEFIISSSLCRATNGKHKASETTDKDIWMEDVGNSILESWNLESVQSRTGRNWYVEAVAALELRVQDLERGSQWTQDDGSVPEMDEAWSKTQILEMIHIMQVIVHLSDSSRTFMRSDAVLAWFRFVGRYGFFEQFETPYTNLNATYAFPFQSLIALISLAMFKIPLALELLEEASSTLASALEVLDSAPFLLNHQVVLEMNAILVEAAKNVSCNASLAVCTWGVLVQIQKEYAVSSQESKDLRQSQRAVDSFDALQASEADNHDNGRDQRRSSPHRRSSIGSDTSQHNTYFEDISQKLWETMNDGEDLVSFLAQSAVDHTRVFDIVTSLALNFCTPFGSDHFGKPGLKMRIMLLDLIRVTLDWVGYQPELLQATLAVLNDSETYWDILKRFREHPNAEPVSIFVNDEFLMRRIYNVALSRFPYETLPFIKLCKALATSRLPKDLENHPIQSLLEEMPSFTCVLYEDCYGLGNDGDLKLTKPLGMLPRSDSPAQRLLGMTNSKDLVLSNGRASVTTFNIPQGTPGQSLTENKPLVVLWRYQYSGLRYLGRLLQIARDQKILREGEEDNSMREVVPEIIGLITAMLASVSGREPSNRLSWTTQDMARGILGEASNGLDRNEDIVSIIFAIFEQELYNRHTQISEEDPVNVLVVCIQFTHALLPILPNRVWPFLGSSGLLGLDGAESRLAAVVTSTELPLGRYSFLCGCIHLFDALIEDSISHELLRKTNGAAPKRFRKTETDKNGVGVTDISMKKILLSYERIMMEVFESNPNWRFNSLEEKIVVNTMICNSFDRILRCSFEVDDNLNLSEKLVGFLAPTTDHLVGVFLSKTTSDVSIQPLLTLFFDASLTPSSTLAAKGIRQWVTQTESAFHLATTLVKVSTYLERNPTPLENRFFEATPVLAKVYAAHVSYRLPVVQLLEALVRCAGRGELQPPSLLGHLGQGTAKLFLEILSMLDSPLEDEDLAIAIWRLSSTVVSNRQRWVAIYLLTGSTPRDTLKENDRRNSCGIHKRRPTLQIALDRLSNLEGQNATVAVSMLEFVSLSADYWPWVIGEILHHATFTSTIVEYLGRQDSATSNVTSDDSKPNRIKITSLILGILAMCVGHANQNGDQALAKKIIPQIRNLMKRAVAIPDYNTSLHSNLRRNFEAHFTGCTLSNFKRTKLERPLLGEDFYYDMSLATKMLSHNPAWSGKRDQGFVKEFARANINLSVVDSQVNLFHAWKFLSIQLSSALATDVDFQKSLTRVAEDCLLSNQGNTLPEAIFERLSQSRADLAFALLQRTVATIRHSEEAKGVLKIAWDTLRGHAPDVGIALTGTRGDYTRTLMKILCLSLQAHTEDPATRGLDATTNRREGTKKGYPLSTVLEILGTVVAHGFRSLTTLLHDDSSLVLAADYALINSILRSSLRVPGIERHTEQLVTQFSDDNTARYASTLLSWSDQLAVDNDPIFGELTMTFLVELSSVPALAEAIAVAGILTQISTAKIMDYFRRSGGIGQFDEPTTVYGIWYRGVLPLVLNLLSAIGAPIAAEVSAFLAQFRGQLARASTAFDIKPSSLPHAPGASYLTLSNASEAQSLALITKILDMFREAGPSAGIVASDVMELEWDRVQVKEDLDNWLQRRKALIVATNEKEEAWARQSAVDKGSAESRLEEKIVEEMRATLALLGNGES